MQKAPRAQRTLVSERKAALAAMAMTKDSDSEKQTLDWPEELRETVWPGAG